MEKRIKLELKGALKRFVSADPESYPLGSAASVGDLAAQLGIAEHEVFLVFVDGVQANLDSALKGCERVLFIAPLCGG
jgi:hypothetical protein